MAWKSATAPASARAHTRQWPDRMHADHRAPSDRVTRRADARACRPDALREGAHGVARLGDDFPFLLGLDLHRHRQVEGEAAGTALVGFGAARHRDGTSRGRKHRPGSRRLSTGRRGGRGAQSARKLRSSSLPFCVRTLSGWNCTHGLPRRIGRRQRLPARGPGRSTTRAAAAYAAYREQPVSSSRSGRRRGGPQLCQLVGSPLSSAHGSAPTRASPRVRPSLERCMQTEPGKPPVAISRNAAPNGGAAGRHSNQSSACRR